jgi:sarcosine oxidase
VVLAELGRDEQVRLAGLPSVFAGLHDDPTYQDLYLVAPTSYPDGSVRLKMGATLRDRAWLPTAGERRTWMRSEAHSAELGPLRQLLLGIIPSLDALSWTTKPCIITDTPTGLPFVGRVTSDVVPELFGKQSGEIPPGLFVAAGGNGFAGKSADAIGALAAGLILEGEWTDPDLLETAFAPQAS